MTLPLLVLATLLALAGTVSTADVNVSKAMGLEPATVPSSRAPQNKMDALRREADQYVGRARTRPSPATRSGRRPGPLTRGPTGLSGDDTMRG